MIFAVPTAKTRTPTLPLLALNFPRLLSWSICQMLCTMIMVDIPNNLGLEAVAQYGLFMSTDQQAVGSNFQSACDEPLR